MVITLFNPKGGAGKTALAIHGGDALMHRGYSVAIADADPLGIAWLWRDTGARKQRAMPTCIGVGKQLRRELRPVIAAHDITIIDTAGRLSDRLGAALAISDLVLVPVKPQVSDVWALSSTIETLKDAQASNRKLKAAIVLCCARSSRVASAAEDAVRKAGVPTLETVTRFYGAYDEAQTQGRGVCEHRPSSKAAADMNRLLDELERSYPMGVRAKPGRAKRVRRAA